MLIILTVYSITALSCIFASTEKSKESINSVYDVLERINTYQANLIARIYPSAVVNENSKTDKDFNYENFMEIKSTVIGESGKKMKLVTIMDSQEIDREMEITLVFDGTWLWVQNKTAESLQNRRSRPKYAVRKIHIPSVSPDPINEPFNTFFGISGTGLYRSKDLPGTYAEILKSYDLASIKSSNESDDLIFEGYRKPEQKYSELEGVDNALKELMEKTTRFCKLWVSKETGLIKTYSMGQSDGRPTILTQIEYLNVNEKLPENTFKYIPPKVVVVRDITSTILKNKEMIRVYLPFKGLI